MAKLILRVLLAALFLTAGVLHFKDTAVFVDIVPPSLPYPALLVQISGVAEILGGLGLLLAPVRWWAGIGLLLLLLAVFPANIYMAWDDVPINGQYVAPWLAWARLPLQPLLMLGVAWVAGNLDRSTWPWRRRGGGDRRPGDGHAH